MSKGVMQNYCTEKCIPEDFFFSKRNEKGVHTVLFPGARKSADQSWCPSFFVVANLAILEKMEVI